jgi:Zn-dependent protease
MELVIFPSLAAVMPYAQVRDGLVLFVGLVLSLALHEFGHAAAAVWLGDDTPRRPARSPGAVLLPLAALFLLPGGMFFGWGRPVPFNPYATGRRVSLRAMIYVVSLAGPAMNLLQAAGWAVVLFLLVKLGAASSGHELVVASVSWAQLLLGLNVVLFAFNLIPVPPLDGGHLLVTSLARTHPDWARWLEQYGLFVFLFLMPILPWLLRPVVVGTGHLTAAIVRLAGG